MTGAALGAQGARLSALDAVLDAQHGPALAGELFAVVDLLQTSASLRRTLTDPGREVARRQQLASDLLQGQIGNGALTVVRDAVAQRWAGGRSFVAALERQAVRAEFRAAASGVELDEIEDELFRFGRLVASNAELRDAVGDRSRPLAGRQELVRGLLSGKVHEITSVLAVRAVKARERTFAVTLEGYVDLAAQTRRRAVATVRVARPLEQQQVERLRATLSRQAGREVAMHVVVDPDVLGGIRVELGDEVIEGTVAARLEDARRRFQ